LIEVDRLFQKENSADWWDELPEEIQESILEGMKDIEKGNSFSHDQVIQEARQKYGF
jgi:predicted transcriptional regulator